MEYIRIQKKYASQIGVCLYQAAMSIDRRETDECICIKRFYNHQRVSHLNNVIAIFQSKIDYFKVNSKIGAFFGKSFNTKYIYIPTYTVTKAHFLISLLLHWIPKFEKVPSNLLNQFRLECSVTYSAFQPKTDDVIYFNRYDLDRDEFIDTDDIIIKKL